MGRGDRIYDVVSWPFLRPVLKNRWLAAVIPWTFQGILYMDRTERAVKLGLDLLLTGLFWLPLRSALGPLVALPVALFLAHTANWVLNGNFFVFLRYFWEMGVTPERISRYVDGLRGRMQRERSLLAAAVYGSLARGELREGSDLDVRVVRHPGVLNGLRACWFGVQERARAAFQALPLDLYVVDGLGSLQKMQEVPFVLHDPEDLLSLEGVSGRKKRS